LIIGGKGGLDPSEYRLKDMNRKRPPTEKELAKDGIDTQYEKDFPPIIRKLIVLSTPIKEPQHFTYMSLCKNILS
jgi:hypothetical protein